MAKFKIDRINTRDVDLLVAENIASNADFARLFMEDAPFERLKLLSLTLWQDDNPAQADIKALFETEKGLILLLLQDNIAKVVDKASQDKARQAGQKSIDEGECNDYRCCLMAPQNYLDANTEELQGFPAVSYQAIREALAGDAWAEFVLDRAIAERSHPFSARKNKSTIDFWDKYSKYVRNVFPDLEMKRFREKTGFQSTDVRFMTKMAGVSIYHKAHQGVVDVLVRLKNWDYARFEESMRPYLFPGMKVKPMGRNALIYIEVPVIHFSGDFDAQLPYLDKALEAAVEMQEFMQELDYGRTEQILQEGPDPVPEA